MHPLPLDARQLLRPGSHGRFPGPPLSTIASVLSGYKNFATRADILHGVSRSSLPAGCWLVAWTLDDSQYQSDSDLHRMVNCPPWETGDAPKRRKCSELRRVDKPLNSRDASFPKKLLAGTCGAVPEATIIPLSRA